MSLSATVAPSLELAASDRIVVGVVAAVALAALAIGFVLLREVLAAGQGTAKMQEIGRAVQEGAAAYLNRQFRTLASSSSSSSCCCSRCPPTTSASGSAGRSSS